MKRLYYLSTCSTCTRIINGLEGLLAEFEFQDIKTERITESQLDQMKELAGSYEGLFSRRAMKYKSLGLAKKELTENDYKKLILEEYTFLKRPVFIYENQIFIGSSKKEVESLQMALS